MLCTPYNLCHHVLGKLQLTSMKIAVIFIPKSRDLQNLLKWRYIDIRIVRSQLRRPRDIFFQLFFSARNQFYLSTLFNSMLDSVLHVLTSIHEFLGLIFLCGNQRNVRRLTLLLNMVDYPYSYDTDQFFISIFAFRIKCVHYICLYDLYYQPRIPIYLPL